jgi:hypothetical protein
MGFAWARSPNYRATIFLGGPYKVPVSEKWIHRGGHLKGTAFENISFLEAVVLR